MDECKDKISTGGFTWLHPKLIRAVYCLIWGFVSALVFPPFELTFLVWFSLLPLIFLKRRTFLYGLSYGFGFFFTSLFWLHTIHIAVVFPLAFVCALFPAVWFFLYGRSERFLNHSLLKVIVLTAAWVGLDWVRSWIMTGFPWNFLGYTQWQNPDVGIIQYTGVYGVTAIIVFVNLILLFGLKDRKTVKSLIPLAIALVAVLGVKFFGHGSFVESKSSGKTLKVVGIQGNIPLCRDYTHQEMMFALNTAIDLSRQAIKEHQPDLVIWAETAVPAALRYSSIYSAKLSELVTETKTDFLIGTVDLRQHPDRPTDESAAQQFNSAMLLTEQNGRMVMSQSYDKTHPVPFGEFTPFEDIFPIFREWIGMGRSLTAGTNFTVFSKYAPAKFGVNICYEDVFPEISQNFVANGANIILTITNDAWYHESAGSRQHYIHSTFRAIENNVHFVRVGNRSYTSMTSPQGKTLKMLKGTNDEVFVKGFIKLEIPYNESVNKTFYTLYGNVFAKLGFIIMVLFYIFTIMKGYQEKKDLRTKLLGETDV